MFTKLHLRTMSAKVWLILVSLPAEHQEGEDHIHFAYCFPSVMQSLQHIVGVRYVLSEKIKGGTETF